MVHTERWPATPPTPPPGARLAADLVDCDLSTGAAFGHGVPHDVFDELRRHGGIAWHAEAPVPGLMGDNPTLQFVDSPGFWAVTSYELVTAVDRDQRRFSSEAGGTLLPSLAEESLAMFRPMMLNMDASRHTRLRRILQPASTPSPGAPAVATQRVPAGPRDARSRCCAGERPAPFAVPGAAHGPRRPAARPAVHTGCASRRVIARSTSS